MLVGPRPARPVRNRRVRAKILLVVVVGLAVGVGIALVLGTRGSRNAPPPSGLQGPLHVRGAQLLDAMGRPLQLRGAQIQSYNVARTYRTTDWFSQSAFEAMRSWGMNEVRIPFSGCLVTADPGYVPGLVRIVGRAEAAGLYVVLALFSDRRAGCSFDGVPMPHLDSVEEWRQVASTFRADGDVLFDLFNEPHLPTGAPTAADWQLWKRGGTAVTPSGTKVQLVGLDQLASALRGGGALSQPVVAETLGGGAITDLPSHQLNDANALYSLHTYFGDGRTTPEAWDRLFGDASSTLPVYIGEWAFLPNGMYPAMCKDLHLTTAAAQDLVLEFMSYLDSHRMSYNVWSFTPAHLIVDETRFKPTTLPDPLVCAPSLTTAGMGALYKTHLQARG